MNDCPNGEVRDLLPDLLNERLDDEMRAVVESHLVSCADCRAELALLGDLSATLRRTPALDVSAIVAAVSAYHAPVRRSWGGWKTAAAIMVIVAGGSAVALLQREPVGVDALRVVTSAPQTAPVVPPARIAIGPAATPTPVPAAASPNDLGAVAEVPAAAPVVMEEVPAMAGRELAMGEGSLNDLSDRELSSLLKAIENLDALPSVDVEQVVTPLGPRRP